MSLLKDEMSRWFQKEYNLNIDWSGTRARIPRTLLQFVAKKYKLDIEI